MTAWPFADLGLVAVAVALLAAPARFEGPVLVPISPGHALSVLDSVALIPLLTGLAWLYRGYGYAAIECTTPCVRRPERVVWGYLRSDWESACCSLRPSLPSGGGGP